MFQQIKSHNIYYFYLHNSTMEWGFFLHFDFVFLRRAALQGPEYGFAITEQFRG